jgi:membrane-associated phospholipid phosphatase
MPGELTNGIGLDVVIWLQDHGNGLFDLLARVLHFGGRTTFFLIVLTLVYWSVNKRLGLRLLFALLVGSLTYTLIKQIVQDPRPFQLHPDQVRALVDQEGYGFPSGHVTATIVVWGTAALYFHKRWAYWLVGGLALLMAWGRMYAGVHYPQDVVGGMVLGLLTLWAIDPLWRGATWYGERTPLRAQIAGVFLAGFVALVFSYDNPDGIAASGTLWGVGFGLIVEARRVRFSSDGTPQQQALRYLGGIVLVGVLYAGLGALVKDADVLWKAPVLMVVGFMAVAGWPYLALRLGLAQSTGKQAT